MIKAIETRYRDVLFRSRLEARWASFFDAAGIAWEYEAEGYEMSTGERYLPDFWLPGYHLFGTYVECKPIGGDFSKALRFAKESDRTLMCAEGQPDFRNYYVWEQSFPGDGVEDRPDRLVDAIPSASSAAKEYRFFWCSGWDDKGLASAPSWLGPTFINAVRFARSQRFIR